jgi:hypothetical protein
VLASVLEVMCAEEGHLGAGAMVLVGVSEAPPGECGGSYAAPPDASFLVHVPTLVTALRADLDSGFRDVRFVDVDNVLDTPRLANDKQRAALVASLAVFLERLLAALSSPPTSEAVPSVSSAPCGGPLFRAVAMSLNPASDPPSAPLCLATLTGWLLRYPVLYFYGSQLEGRDATGENCLGMVPLSVFSLGVTHRTPDGTELGSVKLLQFSVPSALLPAADNGDVCAILRARTWQRVEARNARLGYPAFADVTTDVAACSQARIPI